MWCGRGCGCGRECGCTSGCGPPPPFLISLMTGDRSGPLLHCRINAHLQQVTDAKASVVICLLHSSREALIQAVGQHVLETPLRLSFADPMVNSVFECGKAFTGNFYSLERKLQELLTKNVNVEERVHYIPIKDNDNKTSVITVLVGVKNTDEYEVATAVENVFKYCLMLVVNTAHWEEELRLKQQYQSLLQVARRFFSQLDDFDNLLQGIMSEARQLTSAERCSLFLIDTESGDLVAKVFDGGDNSPKSNTSKEIRIMRGQGIAGHVAETGKILNIHCAYDHPLFYKGLDERTGFITRNILCFPIHDENGIIGVAQLCNKIGSKHFDACDEDVASAFSIYCGLSIMHSIVYKKISDAQARAKVSNEMLMYHLKVNCRDVEDVMMCREQHQYEKFSELHFDCRSLPIKDTPCYILHMFDDLNLSKRFQIKKETLVRFTLYVQRGYRDVPYHNWMHAFSVTHFAYTAISTFKLLENEYLTDIECLAYLVSCLCHDLDHRGTNNSFEIGGGSLLASLYSSQGSIMEHHHLSQALCILNTEDCNILQCLQTPHYDVCLELLRDCILATDLANHFKQMNIYKEMVTNGFCKTNPEHRRHLLTLLMTCADLSDQIKNWSRVKNVAATVYMEFFHQGDVEKQRGLSPQEMMDRDKAFIPDLQIQFLKNITLPVFRVLEQLFPESASCVNIMNEHMKRWEAAKEVFSNADGKERYDLLESQSLDSMIDKVLRDSKNS